MLEGLPRFSGSSLERGVNSVFLRTVEMLSKWSFIDIFILVLFQVAVSA